MRARKSSNLAQSGYTKPCHAPEFPELFESQDQSIDIYSYGVIYWVLLSGDADRLPRLSDENASPIHCLMAKCVAINPLQRPSTEEIIVILESLSSSKVTGFC